jgi:phospholipase C
MSDDTRYKVGRRGLPSSAAAAARAVPAVRSLGTSRDMQHVVARSTLPELPERSPGSGETRGIESPTPVSVPEPRPAQAPGVRYARALPYALHCHVQENAGAGRVEVTFQNIGSAGAVFYVYDRAHLARFPRRYTVETGRGLTDGWRATARGEYDLRIIGPNGFLREFSGVLGDAEAAPEMVLEYQLRRRELELRAWNDGRARALIEVTPGAYPSQRAFELVLPCGGDVVCQAWSLARSGDWYDLSARCASRPSWLRRFAGRMETGRHGVSDPTLRPS